MLRLYVPQAPQEGQINPDAFCWYLRTCSYWRWYSGPPTVRSRASFETKTGGAFKLTFTYTPVNYDNKEIGASYSSTIDVAAGQSSVLKSDDLANRILCSSGRIRLVVKASIPGPASSPVYIDNQCPIG